MKSKTQVCCRNAAFKRWSNIVGDRWYKVEAVAYISKSNDFFLFGSISYRRLNVRPLDRVVLSLGFLILWHRSAVTFFLSKWKAITIHIAFLKRQADPSLLEIYFFFIFSKAFSFVRFSWNHWLLNMMMETDPEEFIFTIYRSAVGTFATFWLESTTYICKWDTCTRKWFHHRCTSRTKTAKAFYFITAQHATASVLIWLVTVVLVVGLHVFSVMLF